MPTLIDKPTIVEAAGNKVKLIKEFFGNANSNTSEASIALMDSPGGWSEPAQTPEFDEYSLVLSGVLHVKCKDAEYDVIAGQAILVNKNEWVQYSTPGDDGAQYISVCIPAFSPSTVHRDE